MPSSLFKSIVPLLLVPALPFLAHAEQKWECFDSDPKWEGINNRSASMNPVEVVQDFGYIEPAGEMPGSVGGTITPDGEAAYYAKAIEPLTFEEPLSASGKVAVDKGGGHFLLGFFNSQKLNEWRTPNTLVFRINGRGDFFHNHIEYTTRLWKAQGTVIGRHDIEKDRVYPIEVPSGSVVHEWSIRYDPEGAGGKGLMSGTFDGESAQWDLLPGHRQEGATFDRFGLLNVLKSVDEPGKVRVFDLSINGTPVDLSQDPEWEGYRNRENSLSREVRPWFDFGFSPTAYAGGRKVGELGGRVFRGDCRYPERMACYGGKVENLSLETPLSVTGKISLRRGVSDSTTLIGYYNSETSMTPENSQQNSFPRSFLGAAVEGPSSEGFNLYPVYRNSLDGQSSGRGENPPSIHPDGEFHVWSLDYDPLAAGGRGEVTVTLDGSPVTLELEPEVKAGGANFDRFGILTTWIDGNCQEVYFDDLYYTFR